MNLQKIFLPIVGGAMVVMAWQAYGWAGAALAGGALVMYLLLHFNRMMHVLRKAADRPKGYVGSAVMLNAKLKPGVNLLHVMALTGSIGELVSTEGEQPEVFRWTDGSESQVTCEFKHGKLEKWTLYRPPVPDEASPPAAS
ncbi:glycerate kinase [Ramlibacter sp. WS9]|uniref:glycerate kinase n=1 Tax=Ramlibacter sp. WS9 TaxID=1882741 RepID=UPI001143D96C|nr:glycerate kinase [Ramlibacter sp. WS9]ROZ62948.1 glycerate kinase [Ramlibacter sp. WS9]